MFLVLQSKAKSKKIVMALRIRDSNALIRTYWELSDWVELQKLASLLYLLISRLKVKGLVFLQKL